MKKIRKGMIFFFVCSCLWIAFVINYLMISGWWKNRFNLSPMEVVGGLGGLTMPLVILFLIAAFFDRSEKIEGEARKMRGFIEELLYPTEEGEDYPQQITNLLRQQIKEFREVYSGVTEHTNMVRNNLQRWIEGLNQLIKTVDTQTVGAVQKIASHIEKLAEITHQGNRQAEQTTALLAGQADILDQITHKTNAVMGQFSKELNTQIQDIQNLIHAMETAKEQIRHSSEGSARIVKGLNENAQSLEKTLSKYDSLKEIEYQAHVTNKEVMILGESVEKRAKSLMEILGQMQGDMSVISQALNAHTQALENHLNLKEKQGRDLLKEASEIVAQLQNFSVELAHLFSPKNEEELWKKYYRGDKAVFMRHLREEIKESKAEKIRKIYRENMAFQSAVNHYMQAFEQMTYEAKENASENPLLGVLIGSDIGRLYMVLAQVIKGGQK